jgi:hypothetical protein
MYKYWKVVVITLTVLGVFCILTFHIWIWALVYFMLGTPAIQDFEAALYFSTTTFTTLGIGDIFIDKDWRLLTSFEAANGMILFGWSTAFIFEVVSTLYKEDAGGR